MAHEDIHRARENGSRQESGRETAPMGREESVVVTTGWEESVVVTMGWEESVVVTTGCKERLTTTMAWEVRVEVTTGWEEKVEVTMGWEERGMGSWLVEVEAKLHLSAMKRFWTRDGSQVSLCPTTQKETENKVQSHSEGKARQNGAMWSAMEIESADGRHWWV